jgi:transposase-like protein
MRNQRTFSQEFKRQVVEEFLSGESHPAQLCRRHNISSSLLYHWEKQYSRGKYNNEPTAEASLILSDYRSSADLSVFPLTEAINEISIPAFKVNEQMGKIVAKYDLLSKSRVN